MTLAVTDPASVASRWAELLGVGGADGGAIGLDGGEVRFTSAPGEAAEGLVEISLTLPPDVRAGREQLELGGVRFSLADAP